MIQRAVERNDREISRKRKVLEATIESLRGEFESVEEELGILRDTECIAAGMTKRTKSKNHGQAKS